MWPFGKREKKLGSLPRISPENYEWQLARGEYEGSPLLVRLNSSAKEWLGHKGLPIKLGFAVPLNAPNPGGLPDPDENQQFNDVEDVIVREVDANARGMFAFVLSTGTMKEFVFYVAPGADIAAIHQAIRDSVSTHEVQCMAVQDPSWDAYTEFGG